MKKLENVLDFCVEQGIIEQAFVRIGRKGEVIYDSKRGNVDELTLFDMASVTKVVATTTLALIALDEGRLSLNDSVKDFYPEAEKDISILDMLIHCVGIGHKPLNKEGNNYENIVKYICSIPSDFKIGETVSYSCPGFIMLGKILEKIYGKRLDEAFDECVKAPLKMCHSGFLPTERV